MGGYAVSKEDHHPIAEATALWGNGAAYQPCVALLHCGDFNVETATDSWGLFYKHGSTLSPAWKNNHSQNKMWDKITYPFPNFIGCMVE